jgi:hypothetical protein
MIAFGDPLLVGLHCTFGFVSSGMYVYEDCQLSYNELTLPVLLCALSLSLSLSLSLQAIIANNDAEQHAQAAQRCNPLIKTITMHGFQTGITRVPGVLQLKLGRLVVSVSL